jgi:hypothetical protein
MVELNHHVRLNHAGQRFVARADHVIAGVAVAQAGKQLAIVGKQVVAHFNAGGLGKIFQRGGADIGIPVIHVELARSRKSSALHKGHHGGNGHSMLKKTTTGNLSAVRNGHDKDSIRQGKTPPSGVQNQVGTVWPQVNIKSGA